MLNQVQIPNQKMLTKLIVNDLKCDGITDGTIVKLARCVGRYPQFSRTRHRGSARALLHYSFVLPTAQLLV